MRAWRIVVGTGLLFLGTVASFKCLGDLQRPLLEGVPGQHSIAGNVIGWLLFGLLPIVLALRLWKRAPGESVGVGRGARHSVTALGSAVFAVALHSLVASVEANTEAGDMWCGVLVLMPLSVCAVLAAAGALVLALVSVANAARTRPVDVAALVAAAASVLLTSP